MKKIIGIALAAVLSGATVKAQSLPYREICDDPMGYRRLSVNLHILNVDLATPTFIRFGVGAEFILTKRISFSADVDKVFQEDLFGVDDAVKKGSFAMEGGAVFNFRARIKKGKIVYAWSEKVGSTKTDYKFKVDGKVLRTIGVRGGLFTFSAAKDLGYYKAYFSSRGLYAGIVFGAQRFKKLSVESLKARNTSKETKGIFYIDAMFAPAISYSDNTDYAGPDARSRNLSSDRVSLDTLVTKNHFGARVGWQKTMRYPWPFQYGWELGMRPGLQKNYYFLFKIAVSIGFIHREPEK